VSAFLTLHNLAGEDIEVLGTAIIAVWPASLEHPTAGCVLLLSTGHEVGVLEKQADLVRLLSA
jgi:hypothetical protein